MTEDNRKLDDALHGLGQRYDREALDSSFTARTVARIREAEALERQRGGTSSLFGRLANWLQGGAPGSERDASVATPLDPGQLAGLVGGVGPPRTRDDQNIPPETGDDDPGATDNGTPDDAQPPDKD